MKTNLNIITLVIQIVFGVNTLFGQETQNHYQLKEKIDTYLNSSVDNGYSASVLVP